MHNFKNHNKCIKCEELKENKTVKDIQWDASDFDDDEDCEYEDDDYENDDFSEALDVCYECGGYGDDYYINDDGDLECRCPICPNNPFRDPEDDY